MDKKKIIAEVIKEIAEGIESGYFEKKVKIGLTTYGSEHGVDEMVKAAEMASKKYKDFTVILIGPKVNTDLEVVEVKDSEEGHKKMVELLESGYIDGAVTQHFDFPIGVATIGRVVTPSKGREVILSSTTGTSSTNRIEGMILNAISGIAVAKSLGIENPTVGILNVEGSRTVERSLSTLKENGYNINFSNSIRKDGGAVMRGNDLLNGTPDVMVCDSLTGNLLIKIFASYTTGGDYETLGYGYGPGIGEGYNKLVNIVSRASGSPLICEALRYSATCAQNKVIDVYEKEIKEAKKFGLEDILKNLNKKMGSNLNKKDIKIEKEVVTYGIAGVDILELDNACDGLKERGIYSETGMGCTGPIILVNERNKEESEKILKELGFK